MLRILAAMVFCVIALYTWWARSYGWSWVEISFFDFWAYQMVFLSSAYLLYRWDEVHGHSIDE
ncbi:hypothetical protein [Cerasicoccus arenae]|uniref:hypothetical protein n=2 Tax=Cerasicoccus arenae TaxID=424488 RepID=UPI00188CC7AA|nr:hypothetical protein [Cerasicoccus arenae]